MSVNEKVDVEAADYGSIAPEPKNAVAYGKRRTIALGALAVLAFGAAVALIGGFEEAGALDYGFTQGRGGALNDPRDGSSDVADKFCPKYCPENLMVCPGPPTGCSYGEAPKNKCGCQTACPPVDCPSKTKTMTNLASHDGMDDDYVDDVLYEVLYA